MQIKRSCNIYARLSSGYTYVGGGIIDSVERTIAADGTVVLKVAGDDNLRELTTRTVKDSAAIHDDGIWHMDGGQR